MLMLKAGRRFVGAYIPGRLNFSDEIDKFVFNSCMELGVYPSPLNYRGFPKSVCTSVNNCVCHGIPDLRPMKDGDIVRYHGQTCCISPSETSSLSSHKNLY